MTSLPNTSSTRSAAVRSACEQLATANHILFNEGVVDGFGHVSMRHPEHADRFLISRNRAPALVTPDDIQILDLQGGRVDASEAPLYLERFIHAAMYESDESVQAVVHNHSAAVLPFAVSKNVRLRPVCHMTGFFGVQVPMFEIRDHAGPASDMLIRDMALGRALAATSPGAAVVLMRGHGVTVSGGSLQEAVFRSVYTERGARIQLDAERLGNCEYLTEQEAANADLANRGQIQRAWDFWVGQVTR
jgi:HCOMODA/2-hydroxy-3-carboxy-muconic semialdehyde decarboxylase